MALETTLSRRPLPAGLQAEAPRQPGAAENHRDHKGQAQAGLQQAGGAEGEARTGSAVAAGTVGSTAPADRQMPASSRAASPRTQEHRLHRFSFCMRSDGVMMSVRRMPNLSLTTTTSPCAIR